MPSWHSEGQAVRNVQQWVLKWVVPVANTGNILLYPPPSLMSITDDKIALNHALGSLALPSVKIVLKAKKLGDEETPPEDWLKKGYRKRVVTKNVLKRSPGAGELLNLSLDSTQESIDLSQDSQADSYETVEEEMFYRPPTIREVYLVCIELQNVRPRDLVSWHQTILIPAAVLHERDSSSDSCELAGPPALLGS